MQLLCEKVTVLKPYFELFLNGKTRVYITAVFTGL